MSHCFRLPLLAFIAIFGAVAFTPLANAAISSDNRNKLINDLYKQSEDGDAGDVRGRLSDYIDTHFDFTVKDMERVIATLKKNRSKLAENVSEEDLERILKILKKKIRRLLIVRQGNITNDTSRVTP